MGDPKELARETELTTTPLAYTLFWDTSHITSNETYDATLVRFDSWDTIIGWKNTRHHEVPNTIVFEADFQTVTNSDYPFNDVNWPLMSRRMLNTLLALGEFPHRVVPVRLVDRRVPAPERVDTDGALRPQVVNDDFVAVQLTEHIDVVDWERSECRRSRLNPERVMRFSKLVLKQPQGGLPPLFRMPSKVSLLFVSNSAREALQASDVRGVTFESAAAG